VNAKNANFLYDDIVPTLQNTIDLCINSATDRHGYVLEHMFTKYKSGLNFCNVLVLGNLHEYRNK